MARGSAVRRFDRSLLSEECCFDQWDSISEMAGRSIGRFDGDRCMRLTLRLGTNQYD
jgi:hypothetical protein